jgi:erythromycin esterase
MCRDENMRFGFTIEGTALEPPEPGSIESAFADAGLALSLGDLRQTRREASHHTGLTPGPDRIRMQSSAAHNEQDVSETVERIDSAFAAFHKTQ